MRARRPTAAPSPSATPSPSLAARPTTARSVDPSDARRRRRRRAGTAPAGDADLRASPRPSIPAALRREVFGFLPYWELTDSSTRLDWEKISTVAYFGVGADGNGNLHEAERRRLDDRRLERLDQLEDDQRHQRRPRAATPGSS